MYEKITLKFVDLLLLAVLKLTIVDHLRVVFSAGVLLGRVNMYFKTRGTVFRKQKTHAEPMSETRKEMALPKH